MALFQLSINASSAREEIRKNDPESNTIQKGHLF